MTKNLNHTINNHIKKCYPELTNMEDQIKKRERINEISTNIERVFDDFLLQKMNISQ